MGKTDKQKVDCRGCAAGSVTVDQARRGEAFCHQCQENLRRVIRGEKLLDANQRVKL